MSILADAAPPGPAEMLISLFILLIGVAVAAWFGAFRRGSVVGPNRIDPREGSGALWFLILAAFGAWVFVPAIYGASRRPPQSPSIRPATTQIGATRLATNPIETTRIPTSQIPTARVATTREATTLPLVVAPTDSPGGFAPIERVNLGIVAAGAGLATLLIGNVLIRSRGLDSLGLGFRHIPGGVRAGVTATLVALPLTFAASEFTQAFWAWQGFIPPQEHQLLRMLRETPDTRLKAMVAISAVAVAPLFEELLFRGHLQTAMVSVLGGFGRRPNDPRFDAIAQDQPVFIRERQIAVGSRPWMRWVPIAVTSMLFALVHEAGWMMPPLFVLSMCIGYVYERTGKLWSSITLHALFNLTSVTLQFVMISDGG